MHNKKKLFIALGITTVAVIFIILAAINYGGKSTATGAPKNGIPVQVEEVKKDTIVSKVSTNGTVEVENKQAIYINTPLKVDEVLVELGDQVKKGQILIKYDGKTRRDLEYQLQQAKLQLQGDELKLEKALQPAEKSEIIQARLNVSQAEKTIRDAQSSLKQLEISLGQTERKLVDAQKTLKNNEVLYQQGAISLVELDKAKEQAKVLEEQLELEKTKVESAALAVQNAEQQMQIAQDNLNKLLDKLHDEETQNTIKTLQNQVQLSKLHVEELEQKIADHIESSVSPMDGTIITLNAEKGMYVNQNQPVIEVADMNSLVIQSYVSEYDAPTIKIGQPVKLTGDAMGDAVYNGEIVRISPKAVKQRTGNGEEVVVEVEISVIDQNTLLKPGYSVEAEIITANKENVTVVPILAIMKEKEGEEVVYVVKDDYIVEKRQVKVGAYADLYVEVSGVNAGEKVITNPTPRIKEGVEVKPVQNKMSGDKK